MPCAQPSSAKGPAGSETTESSPDLPLQPHLLQRAAQSSQVPPLDPSLLLTLISNHGSSCSPSCRICSPPTPSLVQHHHLPPGQTQRSLRSPALAAHSLIVPEQPEGASEHPGQGTALLCWEPSETPTSLRAKAHVLLGPIPALSSSHSPPCSLTQPRFLEETIRHLMVPSQGLCTGGSLLPRSPHRFSLVSPRHHLLREALLLLALLHPILAFFLHGTHYWHASHDFTICYLPPTTCQCHRVGLV